MECDATGGSLGGDDEEGRPRLDTNVDNRNEGVIADVGTVEQEKTTAESDMICDGNSPVHACNIVKDVPSEELQEPDTTRDRCSAESLHIQQHTDSHRCDSDSNARPVNGIRLLTGSWNEFGKDNYLRGCKWSPDGSCLLCCSNDNVMRLYNLPPQLHSDPQTPANHHTEMGPAALSVAQGEPVYDFCWYPRMNSMEPTTCCFVTSCKDHPIQLWDAYSGERRTAYVPYSDMDEVISPHSLAFSLDGGKIYSGFNKLIKVFDISRPGSECTTIRTYERKAGGQPGIISCIAMNPVVSGVFALGSYSCSVGLYSEDVKGALTLLNGISSGVTHLLFSPDGNLLHTALRKHDSIQSWDLRNPGQVLYEMKREACTNQRIYFDNYNNGTSIISGSSDGCVYAWCLESGGAEGKPPSLLPNNLRCEAHKDVVNGISAHPTLPLLATCSGQRSFQLPSYDSREESSASDTDEERDYENSLKMWHIL